jgi:hypothetical protein
MFCTNYEYHQGFLHLVRLNEEVVVSIEVAGRTHEGNSCGTICCVLVRYLPEMRYYSYIEQSCLICCMPQQGRRAQCHHDVVNYYYTRRVPSHNTVEPFRSSYISRTRIRCIAGSIPFATGTMMR